MLSASPKPLIWLLEEATPEVAQLMHHLERSLLGAAAVQRLSYTEALRELPREEIRSQLTAIVTFTLPTTYNLARLLKGQGPRVCFFPPDIEALAELKSQLRWASNVSVVARHGGEAAVMIASGFRSERIVRLQADLHLGALPDGPRQNDQPLRIGIGWHNISPEQRVHLGAEIQRWHQSAPERCNWYLFHFPDDAPPEDWLLEEVHRIEMTPGPLAARPALLLDVTLSDPFWPDALPRPWQAPVRLFLPIGGAPVGGAPVGYWHERLQGLIDLTASGWGDVELLVFRYQPLWRHLLHGEERALPDAEPPDVQALEAARSHYQAWLEADRARWADASSTEAPAPAEAAFHFMIYDFRVQISWCMDLWRAIAETRNGERHALWLAFCALELQYGGTSWLFKRLLARSVLGRAHVQKRRLGRRFWARFAASHVGLCVRWLKILLACGRDPQSDPLGASREVAAAVLDFAGVEVVRKNAPAPVPGVPTIYLMSHRHAELDPFLLLDVLPGELAVVVGARAQRWPLINRLAHSRAFVLTGRERGVVIADAIAAARSRRALALYPEVAEPTYMGEGAPVRGGLLWIVQALERAQVIPVVLDDALTLGPGGGRVEVWFGPPIACSCETSDELLNLVRLFFHQHLARMNQLDGEGWQARVIPQAEPIVETPAS